MTWSHVAEAVRYRWISLLAVCALGGFMGAIGTWLISITYHMPAPLTVQDLRDVDKVAIRGGWLRLHARVKANTDCHDEVHRFLWQWTGEPWRSDRRWVIINQSGSPPTQVGVDTSYELDLPVPGNIEAGQWHYRAEMRQSCSWGSRFGWLGSLFDTLPHSTPDIPVPIENPPEDEPTQVIAPPGPVVILPQNTQP